MQWRGRRESSNIEDRRRMGGGAVRAGGLGGAGVVVVFVLAIFLGVDPSQLLGTGGFDSGTTQSGPLSAEDEAEGKFVKVVLGDTEEIWARLFKEQLNRTYRPATLVLFKDQTSSPCGGASGATGPFYCPADRKVYLDTAFFTTLHRQLGAGGDFAAAYVVAHEIGHHVQNELGVLGDANRLRQEVDEVESNEISVRIELMADCLSGIWAREASRTLGVVEKGDFEEALRAAQQIGDDTLQRNAGRVPMPHTFTHGTSDQRARWFLVGLKSGMLEDCDTFAVATP